MKGALLRDCLHGEVIRKRQIPRAFCERYGIENLYCEDLPDYWRLLYTVVRRSSHRVVAVVAIVDHAAYSRWFPGRRN